MNGEAIILGICCGITILILIAIAFLTFNIFTQVTNSATYATNSDVKKAHTYYLASFVILAISIVVFVMGVVIVGYGKIKHGKGGKKYDKAAIIKEMKNILGKFNKGKASHDEIEELKKDEEIVRSSSGGDKIFTMILFGIALLSLVSLVLTSIGQSYLGKGKSASNTSGTPDSYLSKAMTQGWFAIGLSLLSLCIIITIAGIKISSFMADKKIVKEAKETTKKAE